MNGFFILKFYCVYFLIANIFNFQSAVFVLVLVIFVIEIEGHWFVNYFCHVLPSNNKVDTFSSN